MASPLAHCPRLRCMEIWHLSWRSSYMDHGIRQILGQTRIKASHGITTWQRHTQGTLAIPLNTISHTYNCQTTTTRLSPPMGKTQTYTQTITSLPTRSLLILSMIHQTITTRMYLLQKLSMLHHSHSNMYDHKRPNVWPLPHLQLEFAKTQATELQRNLQTKNHVITEILTLTRSPTRWRIAIPPQKKSTKRNHIVNPTTFKKRHAFLRH